jgi:hypothetical protein
VPANALLVLDPLPALLSTRSETSEAAKRLKGTHDSVQGLFNTLHAARQKKVDAGGAVAKLEHGEVDLLRSAIVFAGAGLDAVLKQLVKDTLKELLKTHASTRAAIARFAITVVKDEPRKATRILTSGNAEEALRDEYVDNLTKGSLQSEKDLINVRNSLGIADAGLFTDDSLKKLGDFFKARNEIVHELDLQSVSGLGQWTRRSRKMSTSRDFANQAIVYSAAFISATDALL